MNNINYNAIHKGTCYRLRRARRARKYSNNFFKDSTRFFLGVSSRRKVKIDQKTKSLIKQFMACCHEYKASLHNQN